MNPCVEICTLSMFCTLLGLKSRLMRASSELIAGDRCTSALASFDGEVVEVIATRNQHHDNPIDRAIEFILSNN